MAITINPATHVISIPKADLTLIQTLPTEIRELDINWFRLQLKAIEDNEEGIYLLKTHLHNTEVSLGGLTYARTVEILEPYTITFEDGLWAVNLTGANNNVSDRTNKNQVSVNTNNSAGLISSPDIEFASFNGSVMIDVINGVSGTTFPRGTERLKSNNTTDALLIAEYRGFNTFSIIGDINLNSGTDFSGMTFIGESKTKSNINVEDSANVIDCEFYDSHITGTLDGGNVINDCLITDLVYVNGYIENCVLGAGTITLGGGADAHFLDCWSGVLGTLTPTINLGGSGQNLGVRNYNGGLKLINKTGTDKVSVDLNSGQVVVDNTVAVSADDQIVIRGIGKLTDNSTGVGNINDDELLNRENINKPNWDRVYVDVDNGVSGTDFPIGTSGMPSNNEIDAITIATNNWISIFDIRGDFIATAGCDGCQIIGHGVETSSIDLSSTSLENATLSNLTVSGNCISHFHAENCKISNVTNISAHLENCIMEGTISVALGEILNMDRCTCPSNTIFNLNGTGSLNSANTNGVITIANVTDVNSTIGITGTLIIVLDNSCTAGTALIGGIGICYDNSNMAVTDRMVPKATWDSILTGATYNEPTSAGRRLRDISSMVVTTGNAVGSGIGNNQIELNGDASTFDGAYDPASISIVNGTGVGQTRAILEYKGSTKIATVDRNWKINPDDTSEYVINGFPGREHINEGLAQAGSGATITLNELASSIDNVYVGQVIFIRSGTGEDQARRVVAYDGTTKIATVGSDWPITPDSTSGYVMLPTGTITHKMIGDAVWDSVLLEHEEDNSFGLIIADIIKLLGFKITKSGDIITIYLADGNTVWRTYNTANGGRVQT